MAKKKKGMLGVCVVGSAMTLSLLIVPPMITNHQIGYTSSEVTKNAQYEATLKAINDNYNITFNNKDLYNSIVSQINGPFTVEKLRNIKNITIDLSTFSNKDLSDLQYFTGLESITFINGVIDCSCITYNQNLREAKFDMCDITNTSSLPNSISTLLLVNTRSIDGVISVPYETTHLHMSSSTCNKIFVKNPENLKRFTFTGYGFLDLADLKDCTNLTNITLNQCPNVTHPEYLKTISDKANLNLDEFCCVWGTPETIPNISKEYKRLMNELNNIANSLTNSTLSDEEKVNQIIMYVLNQISYDYDCLEENEQAEAQLTDYNRRPISNALSENKGVCVGYATLFKALANRLGIVSYQPDSINHTWNMVKLAGNDEYRGYDLTQLDHDYATVGTFDNAMNDYDNDTIDYMRSDSEEDLLFYDFDANAAVSASYNYETNIEPLNITSFDTSIGYVASNSKTRSMKEDFMRAKLLIGETAIALLIGEVVSAKKKNQRKKEEAMRKSKTRKTRIIYN